MQLGRGLEVCTGGIWRGGSRSRRRLRRRRRGWGDDVDDETPFFVGLKTVKRDEGEVGNEDIKDLSAQMGEGEGEGSANLIGEWVD